MASSSVGYHANSHHLVDIIKNEMLKEGWQIRSTISDGYDYVFYSTGEDGYQDIYIRVAAGQYDYTSEGDVQRPDPTGDGYTGYVNFFAYQYFPEDGGPYDGSNEIGKTGPVLYVIQGEHTGPPIEEYDMIASTTSTTRRFVRGTESTSTTFTTYAQVSDGHAKLYYDSGGSNRRRWNLESDNRTTLSNWPNGPQAVYGEYWHDPDTDYNFIYSLSGLNPSEITFHNLDLNTFGTGATVPWGDAASQGWMVKTMGRSGERRLYACRGRDSTPWAYYDIDTDTWSSNLVSPTRGGWGTNGILRNGDAIMVPKEITGYDSDRIYSVRGDADTEFQSIEINDEGEPVGSWVYHDDLPVVATLGCEIFFTDNAMFFMAGSVNTNLYKWEFPANATDAGTWTTISNFFTAASGSGGTVGSGSTAYLHHHLICRVRVSEDKTNQHWLAVDEDRIVIGVKDGFEKYWYSYAGLFETYSDTKISQLTADADSGDSVIFVDDVTTFKIGESYILVDTTGDSSTHVHYSTLAASDNLFGAWNKMFGPSETITVSDINSGSSSIILTSTLDRSYKAGSKAGRDPQPVMLRAEVFDEAYVLNNLNLLDGHNSKDAPYQRYNLTGASTLVNFFDVQPRNDSAAAVPITVEQSSLNSVTGAEVRGQLKNTYYIGNNFSSETFVIIHDQRYVVLSTEDASFNVAIGPLE